MTHFEANLSGAMAVVAITVSIAVLFAFFKPMCRMLAGYAIWGDMLAAGIWVRALGTICAGGSVIAKSVFRIDAMPVYIFGWALVVAAYYMHMLAYNAAQFKMRTYALAMAAFLMVDGAAAFAIFCRINP